MTASPKRTAPLGGQPSGAVETPGQESTEETLHDPSDSGAGLRRKGGRGVRYVLRGTVANGVLRVASGRYVRKTNKLGDVVSDTFEPRKRLPLEIGDQVIVTSPDLDSDVIAYAEVFAMTADGAPRLHVLRGVLADGVAFVLPAGRARPPRTKPRKTVVMPGMQTLAEWVRAVRDRAVAGGGL